ncbi:hypothetical protein [Rhodococcus koreensis]|uniref:hypothetical protein n=1 Tax=Rhodococcus koreensis TaxID=99653 RepID=UPI00366FC2B1
MKRTTFRAAVAAAALAALTGAGAGTAAAAPTLDGGPVPAARVVPGATGPVTDVAGIGFPWAWPWPSGPSEPGRPYFGH